MSLQNYFPCFSELKKKERFQSQHIYDTEAGWTYLLNNIFTITIQNPKANLKKSMALRTQNCSIRKKKQQQKKKNGKK